MKQLESKVRNKGGRPKKEIKKDQFLAVKCSLYERRVIEAKAKSANLSVSEYLREIGLAGKIDRREKTLPKEVLLLMADLKHMAAYFNQIAKKRNSYDELTPLERADLKVQSKEARQLVTLIKTYFQ